MDGFIPDLLKEKNKGSESRRQSTIYMKIKDTIVDWLTKRKLPKYVLKSEVFLLAKKGSTTLLEDTRTIAISSFLLKVIEKVLNKKLTAIWDQIDRRQIGFRPRCGIIPGTIRVLEWIRAREKDDVIAFYDLRKAFDSIEWNLIESQLKYFKVDEATIEWAMYIITNTTLYYKGKKIRRGKGVPQGSIISPILFNVAMDKLVKKIVEDPRTDAIIYADDLVTKTKKGMANCILWAFEYGKSIGLQLNPKKSMYLSTATKKEDSQMQRIKISKGRCYTHLGLDIKINGLSIAISLIRRIKKNEIDQKWATWAPHLVEAYFSSGICPVTKYRVHSCFKNAKMDNS